MPEIVLSCLLCVRLPAQTNDREFKNLMFSSYLPGCGNVRLSSAKKGLLCVSRSAGTDGREPPTSSPSSGAPQPFGGATDGHIVYLELP